MFDYVYEWLKNLVFYMILVTAVMQVIPGRGYEKYIRFFCGLILVILLTTPLFSLMGAKEHFKELYDGAEYERMQREMEEAADYIESLKNPFGE